MRLIGASVPRVEDRRALTGRGRYIDDLELPRMLHATFVRSPLAHGRIVTIDCTEAKRAPGVHAVLTGEDVHELATAIPVPAAGPGAPTFYALADDKVRFVGDPVAIVVAESRYLAEDAAELVDVDYDPLAPVVDSAAGLRADAPLLFDDLADNVLARDSLVVGDIDQAFAAADRTVTLTLRQHRVSPLPMEGRGSIAHFDRRSGELTFYSNAQHPHGLRLALADVLQMAVQRINVVTPDIGGAFGLKGSFSREDFCLAATSRALGRPVKWVEDRVEHLLAAGHARDEMVDMEIAVKRDGTLLAMRARRTVDQGAYPKAPFPASLVTSGVRDLLPGPYRWEAYSYSSTVVATTKCTYVSYRGPWAVETWARERALDEVAREIGMDPAELRARNVIDGGPDDRSITGRTLAGISTRPSLVRALELIDYEKIRDQQRAREPGRSALGIGFATFLEAAPGPPEFRAGGGPFGGEQAKAKLEADGHLTVITAQTPGGQGLETTLAQVAADELGLPLEHVKIVHGDTSMTPFKLIGTGGSMSSTWASGAVRVATRRVKEKVLALAAGLLEVSESDLEIIDGQVVPRGVPAKALSIAQLAQQAALAPFTLPSDLDRVLEAHEAFVGEQITGSGWSGGTHACVVEVDLVTGKVDVVRYLVVEDCGRVINPAIVEGQVRGAVAQAIGEVFYEHAAYDEHGNFLTTTFMDYLVPAAAEVPPIEIDHLETDPEGEFGFRGVGEGGLIVAPAALTNAVADALAPLGAGVFEQYLPPHRILELAGVIRVAP